MAGGNGTWYEKHGGLWLEETTMATGKYLFAALLAAASVPALGAVTVIGSTSARLCYEAADAPTLPSDSLAIARPKWAMSGRRVWYSSAEVNSPSAWVGSLSLIKAAPLFR